VIVSVLTTDQLAMMAPSPQALGLLEDWVRAGKGVAVYQNTDLGQPMVGDRQFVSFRSPDTPAAPLPPCYQLVGVYVG
jgi:hypothetical protein